MDETDPKFNQFDQNDDEDLLPPLVVEAPPSDSSAKDSGEDEEQKKRRRRRNKLTNGVIGEDKIFLFVKKESLPEDEINRFLQLVDTMIKTLDPSSLSDTDVEEICLYYRDRVYADTIYEAFAQAKSTDTNLVNQIEKINKSLEQRKANLGARFVDKGQKRKDTGGESLMDLFQHFQDNKGNIAANAAAKKEEVKANKAERFTNTADYMQEKLANVVKTEEGGED